MKRSKAPGRTRFLIGMSALISTSVVAELQLEEVVVSARKRDETLLDVPISVTAFSSEKLSELGVHTLSDIKNQVPSFHYSDRSTLQTEITIRGVGGNARNIGTDSGVGLYVDGVYAGRTSSYNQDVIDVARVEVLRGPQGTLFGKNTTGGAVNIISVKPSEDPQGSVSMVYGRYDELRIKGIAGGKIADNVFGNIVAATWNRDGYIDNIASKPQSPLVKDKYQNQDRQSTRGQLLLTPTDDLDILFSADYTEDDQDVVLNQVTVNQVAGNLFDKNDVAVDQKNQAKRKMWGGAATIDYQLSDMFTLTSISAYRETDVNVFSDIDQQEIDIAHSGPFTDDMDLFTQELRLTFDSGSRLRGLFGVYWYDQHSDAFRDITIQGNTIIDNHTLKVESLAAYTNFDYDITDKLTATVGLRYTDEKKDATWRQQSEAFFSAVYPLQVDSQEWSPTGSLNYYWTESMSSYVTVSKGFKSGGMDLDTSTSPVTPQQLVFDPEFVTNYEVGFKGNFFDGRASLNVAAFFSDYTDRQVTQFLDLGGVIASPSTSNAGKAEIYGVELESQFILTDTLSGWLNVAFVDGEYTKFDDATPEGGSYTHNTTERTPDSNGALGLQYRTPVRGGDLVAFGDITYMGETYLQADNLDIHKQKPYTMYNARLGYESDEGKWSVYLWGKNLSDKQALEFSRIFLGNQQVLYGEPRTYGVEFTYNFF